MRHVVYIYPMGKRRGGDTAKFQAAVSNELLNEINVIKSALGTDRAGVLKALVDNYKQHNGGTTK